MYGIEPCLKVEAILFLSSSAFETPKSPITIFSFLRRKFLRK
jgi:hypothetical protein